MDSCQDDIVRIASKLVGIDSRSDRSNIDALEAVLHELPGFEIERLDYVDDLGVSKRVAVARNRPGRCIAFCGHLDTVPDAGWQHDPFRLRIEDGVMRGLGAVDMKGPLASLVLAARQAAKSAPVMLVLTADEETSKAGAKTLVKRSRMLAEVPPEAIVIAEPTEMIPVRAHRASIEFAVEAEGVQAHAATAIGRSAAWPLVDFLQQVNDLRPFIRSTMSDPDFDPPVCDVAIKLYDSGNALNVTAAKAAAILAWRYSVPVDPRPVVERIIKAADKAGVQLAIEWFGRPLHLDRDHPMVKLAEAVCGKTAETKSFGTDASELQAIAPCLILGPGSISTAHTPNEQVRLDQLVDAVPLFSRMALAAAGST